MALVNSAFTVNVTPGAMPPTVHVSEYDIGRTYTVTINGENGSVFNIPTGTTATIEGTLNGSVGFTQSATISNNQVSFALSESMTAKSGKAWCKIKLTLNNQPIQTCAFVLAVDRAGVEADTVIGADGFDTIIQDAVDNYLEDHPIAIDPTLTISGAAADAKVTGDEIGDLKSATSDIEDTLDMLPGKNLINFAACEMNIELNNRSGETVAKTGWYVTDWIPVEPNTTYALSGTSSVFKAETNVEKTTYTGTMNVTNGIFTTGPNSRFVRFNSQIEGYTTPQLEKGNAITAYEPFHLVSKRLAEGGLTGEIKQALLDCFENVAWINDQGQTYYNALHTALYPPADLVSIAAVYTQSAVVTESTELDALKSDLVVTATYSDATRREISNYILYGTLTSGESFITVAYGGKTTRFSVTVTGVVLYALPQSESFNGKTGAKSIDTGLQLMATDRSFTIMFSAVTGNGATGGSPIFHCLTESAPYPGLSFQRNGAAYAIGGFQSGNIVVGCSSVAGIPIKVVIRHEEGSQYCYADTTNNGVRNEQVVLNNNGTFRASDKTMILGSYQTATGEKGRFWAGTISEFTVISGVISDAAVDNYLGEEA